MAPLVDKIICPLKPIDFYAVVSRGGRPDLAGESLAQVKAPTLLIAGGYDSVVIQLNKVALSQLNCIKEMEIVPRATHLFEVFQFSSGILIMKSNSNQILCVFG